MGLFCPYILHFISKNGRYVLTDLLDNPVSKKRITLDWKIILTYLKDQYNFFSGRSLAIITNLLRVNITSPGVIFIISLVFLTEFENEG